MRDRARKNLKSWGTLLGLTCGVAIIYVPLVVLLKIPPAISAWPGAVLGFAAAMKASDISIKRGWWD